MGAELTEAEQKAQQRINRLESWERSLGPFRSQYARNLMLDSDDPDLDEIRELDEPWAAIEVGGGPDVLQRILCVTDGWQSGRRYEKLRQPLSIPQVWASGDLIDPVTQIKMLLLRQAGCKDELPLLGTKPVSGQWIPRCRLCGAVAMSDPGSWPDKYLAAYLRDAGLVQEYGRPRRVDLSQPI